MAGWPDDDEVLARTGVVLRPEGDAPAEAWQTQAVRDSNAATRAEFVAILAKRGFTPAQILTWVTDPNPGHVLAIEQALFFFAAKTALNRREPEENRGTGQTYHDRRKTLADMVITDADGNPITPTAIPRSSSVGHGDIKDTTSRLYDPCTRALRRW